VEEGALQAAVAPLERMALADWTEATAAFDSFAAWRDVLGVLRASLQERRSVCSGARLKPHLTPTLALALAQP